MCNIRRIDAYTRLFKEIHPETRIGVTQYILTWCFANVKFVEVAGCDFVCRREEFVYGVTFCECCCCH